MIHRLISIAAAICLGASAAVAQTAQTAPRKTAAEPPRMSAKLLEQLRQGGFIVYFRHGETPNYKDPNEGNLEDCAQQRNLSADGRAQSRAIGLAFRELEIPVGIVRSSPFCRSADTARLAFGRVEKDMALLSNGEDNDPLENARLKHLGNIMKIPPWPGTNTVFVGHGSPAGKLGCGEFLTEGEAAIFRPARTGPVCVANVKPDEWTKP